jgi:hypothetical protein
MYYNPYVWFPAGCLDILKIVTMPFKNLMSPGSFLGPRDYFFYGPAGAYSHRPYALWRSPSALAPFKA